MSFSFCISEYDMWLCMNVWVCYHFKNCLKEGKDLQIPRNVGRGRNSPTTYRPGSLFDCWCLFCLARSESHCASEPSELNWAELSVFARSAGRRVARCCCRETSSFSFILSIFAVATMCALVILPVVTTDRKCVSLCHVYMSWTGNHMHRLRKFSDQFVTLVGCKLSRVEFIQIPW